MTSPRESAPVHPPTGYILDVCRYCGRQAKWPGCEHWQIRDGWTMTVRVTTNDRDRDRLRIAMNEDR